jgi:hypothetical protein
MIRLILIEIVAVPAERSRGRHNPRVVKRKMSNFPTKGRTPKRTCPRGGFRYQDHITIVPRPAVSMPLSAKPRSSQQKTTAGGHDFWLRHIQSWRAGNLPRHQYCDQHQLETKLFNTWVAKLRHLFRQPKKGPQCTK